MHMTLSILKIYLSVYKARSTTYGQVGQLTGRSRPTWPERPVYGLGGVCYFADLHNIPFFYHSIYTTAPTLKKRISSKKR